MRTGKVSEATLGFLHRRLWLWVAESLSQHHHHRGWTWVTKSRWPLWPLLGKIGLYEHAKANLCLACQYDAQQLDYDEPKHCSNCPCQKLWGCNCTETNSVYEQFASAIFSPMEKEVLAVEIAFGWDVSETCVDRTPTEAELKYWHERLWKWLSDNPIADKDEWPYWEYLSKERFGDAKYTKCFACQASALRACGKLGDRSMFHNCEDFCPCNKLWGGKFCIHDDDTVYSRWNIAYGYDRDERKRLAKLIMKGWK